MITFYYVNWSLHAKQAKEIIEASELEHKTIDLSERENFANFAEDTFRHGGPHKLPALIIGNKSYEGLNEIKEYLCAKTSF
jgi:glutaredoxin